MIVKNRPGKQEREDFRKGSAPARRDHPQDAPRKSIASAVGGLKAADHERTT